MNVICMEEKIVMPFEEPLVAIDGNGLHNESVVTGRNLSNFGYCGAVNGIVNSSTKCLVVANLSTEPFTLRHGTVIGNIDDNGDNITLSNVRLSSDEEHSNSMTSYAGVTKKITIHRFGFNIRGYLRASEEEKLIDLLKENIDLFAEDVRDLGNAQSQDKK